MIVAPAWIIAAEASAGTPAETSVPEKVCEAIVAPAVVEAVAPAIKKPETGASAIVGRCRAPSNAIISWLSPESLTMPAMVPVPIRRMETPITFERPNSELATVSRHLPVTRLQTRPPTGSATSGSTAMPQSGRSASRTTTVRGPITACMNEGRSVAEAASSSATSVVTSPARLAMIVEIRIVTTSAAIAGMIFAPISEVSSILKASAAAIVLGFGEMMLPALPPPIIATRSALTGSFALRPTASATGATVITAISMNTPTAQTIIVDRATAVSANRAPSAPTIASAIFAALPVFTNAPTRTPEARIRRTDGIIALVPSIIAATVSVSPPPPIKPPASAPKIRA